MALVLEVNQCPQVAVTLEVDMAATAAVATIRTALGDILRAMKVGRTGSALATAAQYFHIVDKVALGHIQVVK